MLLQGYRGHYTQYFICFQHANAILHATLEKSAGMQKIVYVWVACIHNSFKKLFTDHSDWICLLLYPYGFFLLHSDKSSVRKHVKLKSIWGQTTSYICMFNFIEPKSTKMRSIIVNYTGAVFSHNKNRQFFHFILLTIYLIADKIAQFESTTSTTLKLRKIRLRKKSSFCGFSEGQYENGRTSIWEKNMWS